MENVLPEQPSTENLSVRLPNRSKILAALGRFFDKRRLVVIHYKDEYDSDILFGFYKIPPSLDLQTEVEGFREAQPKLMTLSHWLIKHGAKRMKKMDEQYRLKSQEGGPLIRISKEGRKEIIKPGEKPIQIDLSANEVENFELKW